MYSHKCVVHLLCCNLLTGFMCHCSGEGSCDGASEVVCDTVCIASGNLGLILQYCHEPLQHRALLEKLRNNCENGTAKVGFCCFTELCNSRQAFMDFDRSTQTPPSTEPPTNITINPLTIVVTTTSSFDTISMSTVGMSLYLLFLNCETICQYSDLVVWYD